MLLLFLETLVHFKMLYLLKQLSFSKNFFTLFSITSRSFKIIYFFCHNLKFKFCCQSCEIEKCESKNKKHRTFWNTKFHHPEKFELKQIKNAEVVRRIHFFVLYAYQRNARLHIKGTSHIATILEEVFLFTF